MRKDLTLLKQDEILGGLALREVLSKNEIKTTVVRLARRISGDYDGKIPVMVCVLLGARPFFEDLVNAMTVKVERRSLRISSYEGNTRPGYLKLIQDIESEVEGRDVIIIEDIVDTSKTAGFVLRHIESKNPSSLRMCALIDKRAEDVMVGHAPHYLGFRMNRGFLVGYGMDYKGVGRDLENVYVLEKDFHK